MVFKTEIHSLIYLLDDQDHEVIKNVQQRIISFGKEVLPYLQDSILHDDNALRIKRLGYVIHQIEEYDLVRELKEWKQLYHNDLIKGMVIIERLGNTNCNYSEINQVIEEIRLAAWLELNEELTSFEKIKVLNHVLFINQGFKGTTEDYHHCSNSYLGDVLKNKRGNPISLSIIYMIVAQRLSIPIYGINMPQHFMLGYQDHLGLQIIKQFSEPSEIDDEIIEGIMFYIDPFNGGKIHSESSLNHFLLQLEIQPKPEHFKICSNIEIIQRVIRNLIHSYSKSGDQHKLEVLKMMMSTVK
jgi:regulator of sirC expression with transglutaminase-like and TPR domain